MRLFFAIALIAFMNVMALGADAKPGNHVIEIVQGGSAREYLVHVPVNYDNATPLPLVMMLHGAGGSSRVASKYGWSEKADRENFIAVFPEARPVDPSQPARFLANPRVWDDGSGRGNAHRKGVDDVGYLRAVLDDAATKYRVDPASVYCTGFSNGASMAFRVGVEMSDRIAAIAPVSGHFWIKNAKLSRPVPMIFIIGLSDPLNPMNGGEVKTPWGVDPHKPAVMDSINTWVKLLSLSAQPKEISNDDGIHIVRFGPGKDGTEVQLYTVENLGHEWPGATRVLPESMTGPTRDTPVATDVIWNFFSRNRLSAPTTRTTTTP